MKIPDFGLFLTKEKLTEAEYTKRHGTLVNANESRYKLDVQISTVSKIFFGSLLVLFTPLLAIPAFFLQDVRNLYNQFWLGRKVVVVDIIADPITPQNVVQQQNRVPSGPAAPDPVVPIGRESPPEVVRPPAPPKRILTPREQHLVHLIKENRLKIEQVNPQLVAIEAKLRQLQEELDQTKDSIRQAQRCLRRKSPARVEAEAAVAAKEQEITAIYTDVTVRSPTDSRNGSAVLSLGCRLYLAQHVQPRDAQKIQDLEAEIESRKQEVVPIKEEKARLTETLKALVQHEEASLNEARLLEKELEQKIAQQLEEQKSINSQIKDLQTPNERNIAFLLEQGITVDEYIE
jgi:hypothetical protein